MGKNVEKGDAQVTAIVPKKLRKEIDRLGPKVDMKLGPIVREALERFVPILQQRADERARASMPIAEVV